MSQIISTSQFDLLWVQFYNNPSCSVGTSTPNFDDWVSNIANTPSANAKIFLGVPVSLVFNFPLSKLLYISSNALKGSAARSYGHSIWRSILPRALCSQHPRRPILIQPCLWRYHDVGRRFLRFQRQQRMHLRSRGQEDPYHWPDLLSVGPRIRSYEA